MAYDAFWSFSFGKSPDSTMRRLVAAVEELYQESRRKSGRPVNELYFCERQDLADIWRNGIARALQAPLLIVVFDENYLSSLYCFFEWLAHRHVWNSIRTDLGDTTNKFGQVTTLNLTGRPPNQLGPVDADRILRTGQEQFGQDSASYPDKALWQQVFGSEYSWDSEQGRARIREELTRWPVAIGEFQITAVANVDRFADTPRGTKLVEQICGSRDAYEERKLATESFRLDLEKPLQAAVQLALFCLAFDRYHDGGWGFSLENNCPADEERSAPGPGVDEVNLLAIRALREVLDPASYVAELRNLTVRLDTKTRPAFGITDRKQNVTGCLVRLISQDEAMIAAKVPRIVEEATSPDVPRWIVQEPKLSDNGLALRYVFCQAVRDELRKPNMQDVFGEELQELKRKPKVKIGDGEPVEIDSPERLENHLSSLQKTRLDSLADHASQISALFSSPFLVREGNKASKKRVRSAAQLYLLLSDTDFVARYGGTCLADVWRKLDVENAGGLPASEQALLCLMLSDLMLHADTHSRAVPGDRVLREDIAKVRAMFQTLWRSLQLKLTGPAMLIEIAEMNTIGWAAFLLICETRGVPPRDRNSTVAIWKSGLQLRRDIGAAVRQKFTSADTLREKLVRLVAEPLERHSANARDLFATTTTQQWSEFALNVLSGGILRKTTDISHTSESQPAGPHATHVGMLEVEKVQIPNERTRIAAPTTLRVRSADPGYSKLFLRPFTERTGLRAGNLSRMIRHFGGGDSELVENIANVVVKQCYLVDKDGLEPISFEERTEKIIKSLVIPDGPAEQDILELHGVQDDETVYVRRNATLFEEDGIDGITRTFYRWIFSDMTSEWWLADYPKYVRRPQVKGP